MLFGLTESIAWLKFLRELISQANKKLNYAAIKIVRFSQSYEKSFLEKMVTFSIKNEKIQILLKVFVRARTFSIKNDKIQLFSKNFVRAI